MFLLKHLSSIQGISNPLSGINLNLNKDGGLKAVKSLPLWVLMLFTLQMLMSCVPEEGTINIYSSRHYQTDEELFERFTEETGIEINLVKGGSDQLIKRLELEGSRTPADILFTVDAGRLNQARENDLLQPFNLQKAIPDHLRDPDGYWWPVTKRARVILYHKDRVNPDNITGYNSLTDTVFRDRLVMRSSQNVYNLSLLSSFIARDGEESALSWAKGITENLVRRPYGNDRDQAKAVAAGEGDATIVNTYYMGLLKNSSNASERAVADKVSLFFPPGAKGGTHVNVSGIGISKHSDNLENAKKLIKYLLTESAQETFMMQNFEYPVIKGIALKGLLAEWGSFDEDTTPLYRIGKQQREAVKLFTEAGWR